MYHTKMVNSNTTLIFINLLNLKDYYTKVPFTGIGSFFQFLSSPMHRLVHRTERCRAFNLQGPGNIFSYPDSTVQKNPPP